MSIVTPTTPNVISPDPIVAESIASGSMGAQTILDLRTVWYAKLFPAIGRVTATALTTAAPPRIRIRALHNGTASNFASLSPLDCVANVAATNATTLNGGVSAGAPSFVVTSGTGWVQGDLFCMSSGSSRVEFGRVSKVSGTTITPDFPIQIAHNSGDTITRSADIFAPVYVPGGLEYLVQSDNGNGGQTCIFQCFGETYPSDTIT